MKDMYNKSLVDQLRVSTDKPFAVHHQNIAADFGLEEEDAKKIRKSLQRALADYQERLYAESRQSLLIVFQAMDAAGKDSSIRRLTERCNAQGVRVAKFGKPTDEELAHDYLWRVHKQTPAAGEITVFNRSHYEDVLVVRVHQWVDEKTIEQRYEQINQFESLLASCGTHIVKFMLNISPEYQLSRFQSRLENPEKHWKFNPGDLKERALWDDYMKAYQQALDRCSTEAAPWYVIPSETRWARDYAMLCVVLETLKQMNPEYPEPDFDAEVYTADSIS